MKHQKLLFLILALITGFLLLSHYLNFQLMLSQGDHGRDLYAFQATMNGEMPYRDYWWAYGPLMPYYYALFFKLFGVTIKSILLGKFILILLCGALFFLTISLFTSLLLAYAATLWFWAFTQDFFFTYNHVGGIAMLLAATYALCLYIQNQRIRYLFAGAISLFLLMLIKINFGIATFVAFFAGVLLIDRVKQIPFSREKKVFFISIPGFILFAFLIYYALVHDQPVYVIRQCFPYLSTDHPHNMPVGMAVRMWWDAIALNMNQNWPNRFFAFIVITSLVTTILKILKGNIEKTTKQNFILAVIILIALYIVNIHEYLVSGVLYRTFWSKPFNMLLMFLFIGFLLRNCSKLVQALLISTILGLVFWRFTEELDTFKRWKVEENYLTLERGQVMLGNFPGWRETVEETTRFIQNQLSEDETFFALPYDPLYYYLSGKPSPTRQLIFFDHINIPEEQEWKIIAELEEKKVNYVLLSNRAYTNEPGNGTLGETYCKILADYIFSNFEPIATWGDWQNPPGWAWNHGTKLLKRVPAVDHSSM